MNTMQLALSRAGIPVQTMDRKPRWPRAPYGSRCRDGVESVTRVEIGKDPRPIWGYVENKRKKEEA